MKQLRNADKHFMNAILVHVQAAEHPAEGGPVGDGIRKTAQSPDRVLIIREAAVEAGKVGGGLRAGIPGKNVGPDHGRRDGRRATGPERRPKQFHQRAQVRRIQGLGQVIGTIIGLRSASAWISMKDVHFEYGRSGWFFWFRAVGGDNSCGPFSSSRARTIVLNVAMILNRESSFSELSSSQNQRRATVSVGHIHLSANS